MNTPQSMLCDAPYPLPPSETMPTMYDLPSEDPEELGLPDEFHVFQPQFLRETFQPTSYKPEEFFIGTDINLYYDGRHSLWHKRPDWFVVLGVPRAQRQEDLRWSYLIWQEGVAPFLVVELLSPGTEAEDLGNTLRSIDKPPTKWQVYEQVLRIPYYVLFDRYTNTLRIFQLVNTRLEEIQLTEPRFWFSELEMGLGVWDGSYEGTQGLWLRWYDGENNWLPTPSERAISADKRAILADKRADTETQRAILADRRADTETERADRLAEKLRALGIDPDEN